MFSYLYTMAIVCGARKIYTISASITIISAVMGVVSYFHHLHTRLQKIENDIHEYIDKHLIPERFVESELMTRELSRHLQAWLRHALERHRQGIVPPGRNLKVQIALERWTEGKEGSPGISPDPGDIPAAPQGYSWLWFLFNIKREWDLIPVPVKQEAHPKDHIADIVVMSELAYRTLLRWRRPSTLLYYPVPYEVLEGAKGDQELRTALLRVRYMEVRWVIEKCSSGTHPRSTGQLIAKRYGNNELDDQLLESVFPGIRLNREALDVASSEVYEIHRLEESLDEYVIKREERDYYWHFVVEEKLWVLVEMQQGEKPISRQYGFLWEFGQITTVQSFEFRIGQGAPVSIDRLPWLTGFAFLRAPDRISRRTTGQSSIIQDSSGLPWFPGDVIFFPWSYLQVR
jgi:hypothetical protein